MYLRDAHGRRWRGENVHIFIRHLVSRCRCKRKRKSKRKKKQHAIKRDKK